MFTLLLLKVLAFTAPKVRFFVYIRTAFFENVPNDPWKFGVFEN